MKVDVQEGFGAKACGQLGYTAKKSRGVETDT